MGFIEEARIALGFTLGELTQAKQYGSLSKQESWKVMPTKMAVGCLLYLDQ